MTFVQFTLPEGEVDRVDGRPRIDEASLAQSIGGDNGPFSRVVWREEVTSTNDVVAAGIAAAPQDWPDLTVLGADHQTQAHGRLQRTWQTPARTSLLCSVVLRPQQWGAGLSPEGVAWLPLLGGLAAVRALSEACGVSAGLKWPNDVIMPGSGAKLAGVLARAVQAPDGLAVVLGCGINLLQTREELPVDSATSATLEDGQVASRASVAEAYLLAVGELYVELVRAGGNAEVSGLASEVRGSMLTLGQRVRASFPDGTALVGRAESLDAQGRLLVSAGGETTSLTAADITHLRAVAEDGA